MDGAHHMIAEAYERLPELSRIFADRGHAGAKVKNAMAAVDGASIEIVKCAPRVTIFVVMTMRAVVEHAFAWGGRCRRLAKDWEWRCSDGRV